MTKYKVSVDFKWARDVEASSFKEAMDLAWQYYLRPNLEEYVNEQLVAQKLKKERVG